MLLIIGTIRVPHEKMSSVRPAMERMVLASRAENGCAEYSYSEDVLEPGLIHVKERWLDQASLDGHFASAHIAAWRLAGSAFCISDRKLSLYEIGEPRPI